MTTPQNVINIAVPVTIFGHHFLGITVHPGVKMSLKDAGCGILKTQVIFENANIQPIVFLDGITSADFNTPNSCPLYLQIGYVPPAP